MALIARLALALLVAVLAPCLRAAEPPAGIVMMVSGVSDPPLSPMTEIASDTSIKLGPETKLTFLDYARCKLVTIVGGTLMLRRSDYKTDGRVESETDGPCPKTYSLADEGGGGRNSAGLVVRGPAEPPRWPVNTQFLLTGPGARRFATAAVYAEQKPANPVATFSIADGRMVAPPGSLPLLANRRYVLRLVQSDQSPGSNVVFIGTAPLQPQPIVILRVD